MVGARECSAQKCKNLDMEWERQDLHRASLDWENLSREKVVRTLHFQFLYISTYFTAALHEGV